MSDEHGAPDARTIEQGYEASLFRLRGFVIFLVCFVLSAVLIDLGLWWLMGRDYRGAVRDGPPRASALDVATRPPEPELQPSPGHDSLDRQDLAALRAAERNTLDSYGWNDAAHTSAHVPIDRAMELLLQHGLPTATQPAETQGGGP